MTIERPEDREAFPKKRRIRNSNTLPSGLRVDAARGRDVVVADRLADPRPRHAGEMQDRDAPMPEVVRRERRYARGGRCSR